VAKAGTQWGASADGRREQSRAACLKVIGVMLDMMFNVLKLIDGRRGGREEAKVDQEI